MHAKAHSRPQYQRRFTSAEMRQSERNAGDDCPTTAQRMAAVFVDRQRDGFDDTTHIDLVREGFSQQDIIKHYDEANSLAGQRLNDVDVNDERSTYDREARVMVGANAVAGMLLKDTGAVHTACRLAGLQTKEIGRLFDDIVGEALRLVRQSRTQTVEAH